MAGYCTENLELRRAIALSVGLRRQTLAAGVSICNSAEWQPTAFDAAPARESSGFVYQRKASFTIAP
jgi:hypothetical protein